MMPAHMVRKAWEEQYLSFTCERNYSSSWMSFLTAVDRARGPRFGNEIWCTSFHLQIV